MRNTPIQTVEVPINDLIPADYNPRKHDDLADAFSLLILKVLEEDQGEPSVIIIDMGSSMYDRYSPLGNLNEDRLTFDTKF